MAERILVVDDEEPIRAIIKSILDTANYQCQQCDSGTEALRILDENGPFQLLIYDLHLKDMGGIALLARIRDKYPELSVVMVTTVHNISVAVNAIRNGAYDYLLKPFEREQLLITVARALEHRRLLTAMKNLERSYDCTIEMLGNAFDAKGQNAEGHARRVTLFMIAIAQAMGLPREQIRGFARGAFLHDIGKIAIPDSILSKPGRLVPEETVIMQTHSYRGYQMIHNIPFLADASEIVWCHHENFDGSGYPWRLKGEEIPLGARIVAIANTLDSMTSDLPHRPAQSFAAAHAEIVDGRGVSLIQKS